jgi:hypothetical protein
MAAPVIHWRRLGDVAGTSKLEGVSTIASETNRREVSADLQQSVNENIFAKYDQYNIVTGPRVRLVTAPYGGHKMPYTASHRARTKNSIIDSARKLFNRHGFENVSIGQIMAGAGLTQSGSESCMERK